MKIVQSFWTQPFLQSGNHTDQRLNGGWPKRKYNYFSWILSCLQLRKYYDAVELVTDTLGAELLIGKLGLPYTQVSLELDALAGKPSELWALGKIHAYGRQRQPFLHVDNDIFIYDRFDTRLEHAPLAAQNRELSTDGYWKTFSFILKHFSYIPPYLKQWEGQRYMPCANVGIIGGCDTGFIALYVSEVLAFLDRNETCVRKYGSSISAGTLNVFFEQVIFYCLAAREGLDISYLFAHCDNTPVNIAYFHEAPRNRGFVHAYAGFKARRIVYENMENELRNTYPVYYAKTLDLLNTLEL